ncbi:MAG TPA: FHA domain-containing protein [Polyangiaceae bacterium]|nr:FHA domain-containing protein [Polyangiaceae bacterium]
MTSPLAARSDFGLTGRPVSFDAGLRVLGLYDWSALGVTYRVEATLSDAPALALHVFGSAACPSEESVDELLLELAQHERSRPALNSGRLSDGRPGVLFPFESAHLLADFIEQQTQPVDALLAVRFICSLCEALHGHGLAHGELSPRCILVRCTSSSLELARVLGWGFHPALQRLFEAGLPGALVEYRAPERFRGSAPKAQADVFALGSILARLLARSFPTPPATVEQAEERALAADFEPGAGLLAQVPRVLQPILERALRADPQARFASAWELREALLTAAHELEPSQSALAELDFEPDWVSPAIMYPELGRLTRSQVPLANQSSIREVAPSSPSPSWDWLHGPARETNATGVPRLGLGPARAALRHDLTCTQCGKVSPEHYKFCLGCGANLPRELPQPHAPVPIVARAKDGAAADAPNLQESTPPRGVVPAGFQATPPAGTDPDSLSDWTDLAWSAPVHEHVEQAFERASVRVMPTIPITAEPVAEADEPLILPEEIEPPSEDAPTSFNAPAAEASGGVTEDGERESVLKPGAITALNRDGSTRAHFALIAGQPVLLGAQNGAPEFAHDPFLSREHARFELRQGRLYAQDLDSLNGIYLKLPAHDPCEVFVGDYVRIGQQVLRVDPLLEEHAHAGARLVRVSEHDTSEEGVLITERGTTCGRERGHLLFPEDGYVSSLHCRLILTEGRFYLTDLGSSNGTFVRLRAETELEVGDLLLMGQQLLRIEA